MRRGPIFTVVFAILIPVLATTAGEARGRHHHRHHTSCDGFRGCRCGTVAARLHGLPLNYRGHNLKQARDYKAAFPRISYPVSGAIVYQYSRGHTGHVSTIQTVLDRCHALVQDDRGTYGRDICRHGAVILAVN